MKKILIALVAVLLILIGAGVFLASNLDGYIKETIEKEGSIALGSQVSLQAVETDLAAGSAKLSGLSIANPKGYSSEHAFSVNTIQAKVDYGNQIIEEVLIEKPTINADVNGTRSNFQDLVDQMPETADESEAEAAEEEPTITINSFKLLEATVNLTHDKLGATTFVMDDLILSNITGTPTQISEIISKELTSHVSKQTTAQVKGALTEKLNSAKEAIREKMDDAAELKDKVKDKVKGLKLKFGSG